MKLTILGSGTCVPSKHRSSSGLFLSVGTHQVLFDGGSGTIRRLLETPYSYKKIDLIFYTHTHPDHVGDLVPLLMALNYTPKFKRVKPLKIYGPPGFKEFFHNLGRIYGSWVTAPNFELDVFELDAESLTFDDWHISSKAMSHSKSAIGYRVEHEGKVFAYSGDTSYCDNVVKITSQADLAVLECSFPDDEEVEGHLTPSSVARIAHEAQCKRLLLTHFYPSCEDIDVQAQCAQFYAGEIIMAQDLMTVRV